MYQTSVTSLTLAMYVVLGRPDEVDHHAVEDLLAVQPRPVRRQLPQEGDELEVGVLTVLLPGVGALHRERQQVWAERGAVHVDQAIDDPGAILASVSPGCGHSTCRLIIVSDAHMVPPGMLVRVRAESQAPQRAPGARR